MKLWLKSQLYKFTLINQKQSKNRIQTRIIIFRNYKIIREYKKKMLINIKMEGEDVPKLESVEVV